MADSQRGHVSEDRRVIEALADLFDQIPPENALGAEQELTDTGLDPARVGERIARAVHDDGVDPAPRATPTSPRTVPRSFSRRPWLAAAALAAVLLFAVRTAIDQRSEEPPPRRMAAATGQRPEIPPVSADPQQLPDAREADAPRGLGAADAPDAARDEANSVVADVDDMNPPFTRVTGGATDLPEGSFVLDAANWKIGAALLPEPVLRRVRSGDYWYRVDQIDGDEFRENYPKSFWSDARANEGRFAVDDSTCGLIDLETEAVPVHLSGFPFPTIDAEDPTAGCRIAWNMRAADALGRGQESTLSIDGFDREGATKRLQLWSRDLHFLPDRVDEPENLRYVATRNVIEPTDVDGVAGLVQRINDATSPDKIWTYVPSTRRVRRTNPAARSEPIADLAIFIEDLGGFASKIESFEWQLIGEGETLAPIVANKPLSMAQVSDTRFEIAPPAIRAAYETPDSHGAPWLVVQGATMVPRPVWIVEGRPRDPEHKFGKVVFYIDREMYRIYWKFVHDRSGRYFYNAMFSYYWSQNTDGSQAAVIPAFIVGVDEATNRAAIAGRPAGSFVDSAFQRELFTLRTLTALSD